MKGVKIAVNERMETFEKKAKNLLFLGVKWYKLSNGLSWPEIGAIMRKNGHSYNHGQFRSVHNNWAADKMIYFSRIYAVLGLPDITPELAVKWEQEIKRLEAEKAEAAKVRRAKVEEGRIKEAERISAGKKPKKYNDKRKN